MVTTKRIAISKANAQMVIAVAVASFITVFCLIAAQAVFSQNRYNARLTKEKETARNQLDDNLKAFDQLVTSYKKFDAKDPNLLSGSKAGSGDNDGSNSKLVLDALPSSYDFPALTSSLEKILTNQPFKLEGIGGTDGGSGDASGGGSATATKTAASPMPFTFSVSNASYDSATKLIERLERSIRPMQIDSISVTGGGGSMKVDVSAHTYYQPSETINITQKVVK